jgi:hypothetical protein
MDYPISIQDSQLVNMSALVSHGAASHRNWWHAKNTMRSASEGLCCTNHLTAGLPLLPDRVIPRPV